MALPRLLGGWVRTSRKRPRGAVSRRTLTLEPLESRTLLSVTTPTVTVTDPGGVYNGLAYAATAKVAGSDQVQVNSLEGVAPTLTYYVGTGTSGSATSTAPSAAGTYTVIASFAGSTSYASAQSSQVVFTITKASPLVTVVDAGGTYTGTAFPALVKVAGVVAGVDTTPSLSLEGITPTVSYYAGSTATGTPLAAVPSVAGAYTVVAAFAGSTDYAAAASSPATFTIA